MIEPTDEMRAAVRRRMGVSDGVQLDPWMEAAIEDLLAIVQQRYILRPVTCDDPHPGEDLTYCELLLGHDGEHEAELTKVVRW